jgi:deoxyribose-phosphate aldolase
MKFQSYHFTSVELQNRIRTLLADKSYSKERLKFLLSAIDLTSLEARDTHEKIKAVCHKAFSFSSIAEGMPNVAAVCFYPPFMATAKQELMDKGIALASVAGAFPSGQSPLFVKLHEIQYAIDEGAEEIDMVISRGTFLEGKYMEVMDEIQAIKIVCGDIHLKVILETGELQSPENIRKASELAILGGGDFLKTSTGKVQPAATLEAFLIMLDTIKEYYDATGKMIGIKAAGGISTYESAMDYYWLTKKILGDKWLNSSYFRIGASRLADNLVEAILAF